MNYQVEFRGEIYDLPKYSLKIAEQIEKQETVNNKREVSFKEKCKKMYEFVSGILDQDKVESALGKFNAIDPNELNMLYLSVVKSYNRPLSEFNQEIALDDVDLSQFDKLVEIANAVEKMKDLDINK